MGKAKKLTEYEKGQIDQLSKLGWSIRKISTEAGRSKSAVQSYLKRNSLSQLKKCSGRPKKLGPRTTKRIFQLIRNKSTSCRQIKHVLDLSVSKSTIHRAIVSPKSVKFVKKQGRPQLSPDHKTKRFNYALEHITWNQEWDRVIFSDEKKFNLDGPDGFQYYWHDLRTEPLIFSKRVQGGGSVMIWMGFCATGKTRLAFVETTMKAPDYTDLLSRTLLPFIHQSSISEPIFQQDNAPCHRAKTTKEWIRNKGIQLMDWPSRSPDLNPIENLWGVLARKVYEGGRQFNTIGELKSAIMTAADQIESEYLVSLARSMPNRMKEVLKAHGKAINY